MDGAFLHGNTEDMHVLANGTRARAEDFQSNNTALGNHNQGLAGVWKGGAYAAFTGVEADRLDRAAYLANMRAAAGDNLTTAANSYETADSDGTHVVSGTNYGLGSQINT
ncbi:WXG100 family type VII secretion target [Actinokineospora sp. HUAS TT18]|uniref:WXG100 family type VII secretion target n=1 Tax=Actinokineospora sp. HUAS TT18 TaxID=3447451 RepID=UPI003F51BDCB